MKAWAAAAGAGCALALLAALVIASALIGGATDDIGPGACDASAAVPTRDVPLFVRAARRTHLDPALLMAVAWVESDFGRDMGPSSAGAVGYMQFLPATWARYGVDGNRDGRRDPRDPADAIPAAARYLRASGAPADVHRALYAYNHAGWYVDEVLARARQLRAGCSAPTAVAGALARLRPDGLAAAPADAPRAVQRMIAAANAISDTPYVWGGGHPDFLRAQGFDCSSATSYVLHAGGALGTSALASGQFEHWGEPGPGRWVTVYANPGHVFLTVAGLRFDTSHHGTDNGPNRDESGPRWRQYAGIPDWAPWVVRHPAGL